jgi:hypothetical protein
MRYGSAIKSGKPAMSHQANIINLSASKKRGARLLHWTLATNSSKQH